MKKNFLVFKRDLKSLSEENPRGNLKQAFTASDSENISRVVDYADILNKENLDQLFIMTYLFQLRDHFERPQMSPGCEQKTKHKSPFFTLQTSGKTAPKEEKLSRPREERETELNKQGKNTSTPIKSCTIVPNSAPISRKTRNFYRNPFDDDDEDENDGTSTIDLKKGKEVKKSGLLEINSNGEIFDVEEKKRVEKEDPMPVQTSLGSKHLSRRESLNKSSSSSASSLNSSFKVII